MKEIIEKVSVGGNNMKNTIKELEDVIEKIRNIPFPMGDSGVHAQEAVSCLNETINRVKDALYSPLIEEEYILVKENTTFIEAVKKFRDRTNSSLLEAKSTCERVRDRNK